MPGKIFALLVAINEYHPKSNVSSLNGCINDKNNIEAVLKDVYNCPSENIRSLENEAATRAAIIRNFQEHLCNNDLIAKEDLVLFYFSGHGSYAPTAQDLEKFDPQKQDETLVCYDSRLPGTGYYDLADKEIALLLDQVNKEAEIIVLVDACHSGSITRDIAMGNDPRFKARFTPHRKDPRPLGSYLTIEKNSSKSNKALIIPQPDHIAFSACDRTQKAWEFDGQGVFTYHLCKILEKTKGQISYLQVYEYINAAVLQDRSDQTPDLYFPKTVDPYQTFLGKNILDQQPKLIVFPKNDNWCLNHGAIYGLKTDKEIVEKMQIAVFREDKEGKTLIGNIGVKAVHLKECHLEPELLDQEVAHNIDDLAAFRSSEMKKKDFIFSAAILSVPPNLFISLKGSSEATAQFRQHFQTRDYPFIRFSNTSSAGLTYELAISPHQLSINYLKGQSLLHGCLGTGADAFDYILKKLAQIEIWERLIQLENKATKLDDSSIEFQFLEERSGKYHDGPDIYLNLTPNEVINYTVRIRNLSNKNLYIGLLYLSPKFGVKAHYHCQLFPADNQNWINIDKGALGFVRDEDQSVRDTFKLVVSTEQFNDFKFSFPSIPLGEVFDWNAKAPKIEADRTRDAIYEKPEEDWFTQTINVNLTRQGADLGNYDTALDQLTFKKHSSFKAQLSIAPLNQSHDKTHTTAILAKSFNQAPFRMLAVKPDLSGSEDHSLIQLNNLQQEKDLVESPLYLEFNHSLTAQEYLFPITFDGEFFLPVGHPQKTVEDKPQLQFQHLPSIRQSYEKERTRSIQRAFWFGLLQMIGQSEKAFKLRYIYKYEDGIAHYGEQGGKQLAEKVEKADKILLLIHGIIGNTQMMANAVGSLQEKAKYSLILTFDYENLHSDIESIADYLDKNLEAIGLGKHSSKTIDVVAHSMGGLVIRHLIERIRKDHMLVDNFLLLGTPNGGSKFSNLTKVRDASLFLFTIAANTTKDLLPGIAPWLYGLNAILAKTKPFSTTLAQMHPDSTFIKNLYLNEQKKGTKYHLIIGNASQYEVEGNWWKRLKEKCTQIGLSPIYWDTPSDLVVSIAQAKRLPDSFEIQTYEVGCFHTNYFKSDEVMSWIKRILQVS